ncbi:MAG: hypothetical protein AAFN92_21240 [Bacteroidota bacterium]
MLFVTDRYRNVFKSPGRRFLLAVLGSVAFQLSPLPLLLNYCWSYVFPFLATWEFTLLTRLFWILLGCSLLLAVGRKERRRAGKCRLTRELLTAPLELLPEGALFLLVYSAIPDGGPARVMEVWHRILFFFLERCHLPALPDPGEWLPF